MNWYGIKGVKFIYHGDWSDPEVEYLGVKVNSTIVEDTMWERFIYDDDGNVIKENYGNYDGFAKFMKENAREVKELIVLAMEPVATIPLNNFGGIEILYLDPYCEYVITAMNNGDCRYDVRKNKLYCTSYMGGKYYFKKHGHRYDLNSAQKVR